MEASSKQSHSFVCSTKIWIHAVSVFQMTCGAIGLIISSINLEAVVMDKQEYLNQFLHRSDPVFQRRHYISNLETKYNTRIAANAVQLFSSVLSAATGIVIMVGVRHSKAGNFIFGLVGQILLILFLLVGGLIGLFAENNTFFIVNFLHIFVLAFCIWFTMVYRKGIVGKKRLIGSDDI